MSDKGKKTSFDIDCQISALDYLFFLLDCHFLEMQFIIQVEEIQSTLYSLSLINCIFFTVHYWHTKDACWEVLYW